MKRATVAAFLLLLLGITAVLVFTRLEPWMVQRSASRAAAEARDAETRRRAEERAATTLRVAGDGSLAQFFLGSPEMRKRAGREALTVHYVENGESSAERLRKLAAGVYQAVAMPVADYLALGGAVEFPGVIVAALAESRGADGIVVPAEMSLDAGDRSDGEDDALVIVHPATGTGELLLELARADATAAALALDRRPRRSTYGPREVLDQARAQDGVFVLREPELSRALELPGMRLGWSSERSRGYLVDVLIVGRQVARERPEVVRELLATYFDVLDHYAHNRSRLLADLDQATGLGRERLETVLGHYDFFDLEENRRLQLATPANDRQPLALVDSIIACTDLMVRGGQLESDPLGGNPYRVLDPGLLPEPGAGSGAIALEPLTPADWTRLEPVADLAPPAIVFPRWSGELDDADRAELDHLAARLGERGHLRLRIAGYTAPGGDEAANRELARTRAEAVRQYLENRHDVAAARISIEGVGAGEPPPRVPDEGARAYRDRLSRVELVALAARPL